MLRLAASPVVQLYLVAQPGRAKGKGMSKHEKAVQRLLSKPADFTWSELMSLMESFGYEMKVTGGSGRKFIHSGTQAVHFIHEPHPSKILKSYQIRDAIRFLTREGHIA
jgi:hypothetical protein